MINDIFKIPVWQSTLALDNKPLLEYIHKFKKDDKENKLSVDKSNDGGYQSPNLNLDEPIFNNLFNSINKELYKFGKELKFLSPLQFSNLWFNINGNKDSNRMHNHGGVISGVYYVKVPKDEVWNMPKDCGQLIFYTPDYFARPDGWNTMKFKSYDERNSLTWKFTPKENELYLFPSHLVHSVGQNKTNNERISFSFNFLKADK